MDWKITVGEYQLMMLDSVEIHKSVDLLSDTAVIKLPGTLFNSTTNVEDKIRRGSKVIIELGYNEDLHEEFIGYVKEISTENGCIRLTCEDALFLMRNPIPDKEFTDVTLTEIVEYVSVEVKEDILYECDYEMKYDKFIIKDSTGYDILMKLQQETRGNIYFKERTLHVHPAYEEIFGRVKYDFALNIEKSGLQYKNTDQHFYQIDVETTGKDGKTVKVTVGEVGGDKKVLKVYGITDEESMKRLGEEEIKRITYNGYDGYINTFLIPFVDSGYLAHIHDEDDEHKDGWYYVNAVTTTFSKAGAVRKVQLGFKYEEGETENG
ncbi:MAG: hypothetical protein LUG18_15195 [Candidatus Azobacteroides sp.]|nr:hypothetical protein [Candidatus Azobacteroides sp.]